MNKAPASPPADDKDWTWVIRETCPECGFDPSSVRAEHLPDDLLQAATRWQLVLQRPGITARPSPRVWSPLEYAAHVIDVYLIMSDRAELMLAEPEPNFPNWDQDATALEKRYWQADTAAVAVEIGAAAGRLAGIYAAVRPEQWERIGHRSGGAVFTVRTLGIYCLHDLVHHLHDVTQQ